MTKKIQSHKIELVIDKKYINKPELAWAKIKTSPSYLYYSKCTKRLLKICKFLQNQKLRHKICTTTVLKEGEDYVILLIKKNSTQQSLFSLLLKVI